MFKWQNQICACAICVCFIPNFSFCAHSFSNFILRPYVLLFYVWYVISTVYFENKVNRIEAIGDCLHAVTYECGTFVCINVLHLFYVDKTASLSLFFAKSLPPVLLVSCWSLFCYFHLMFLSFANPACGSVILYRCISPLICSNKIYCSFFAPSISHVQSIFSFRNLLFTRCIPFSE